MKVFTTVVIPLTPEQLKTLEAIRAAAAGESFAVLGEAYIDPSGGQKFGTAKFTLIDVEGYRLISEAIVEVHRAHKAGGK